MAWGGIDRPSDSVQMGHSTLKEEGGLQDTAITFFGSNGNSLWSCTVQGGAVTSHSEFVRSNFRWTSGGLESLIISSYEEVWVVAGLCFSSTMGFWAGEPKGHLFDLPPISRALAFDILSDVAERWDVQLARRIAQNGSETYVRHLGSPLRSENEPKSLIELEKLNAPGSAIPARLEFLRGCIAEKANALASRTFNLVAPPENTVEKHRLFTMHTFCMGLKRLTADMAQIHPDDDYGHMNANYGKTVLKNLI